MIAPGRGVPGPGRSARRNGHVTRHLATATKGRSAWVIGRPDLPHSWTDVADMARTLVAVADRPETWGHVWHAPTNPPRTQRQALTDVLAAGGHAPVAVRARPYVLDSRRTEAQLGLAPTPWAEVCRRTSEGNRMPVSAGPGGPPPGPRR